MYLLSMLAVLTLNGVVIAATFRRLSAPEFGRAWRMVLLALTCCGFVLGAYLLNIRYLVSPTSRVYGFPFCIAGGDLLGGRWLDGGVGRFLPLAVLANLASGIAACLLPVLLASFICVRKTGVRNGS
jgi:hypothetical protein